MDLMELAGEAITIFERDLICKHTDIATREKNYPERNAELFVDCVLTTEAIMDPIEQLIKPICLNLIDQKNRIYQNWKFTCLNLRKEAGIKNCVLTHKGVSVMIMRFYGIEDRKDHFVFKIGLTYNK